jgi:HSP20 family protein
MTVTLWNPSVEIDQLNRMFNDVFSAESHPTTWTPAVDVFESANKDVVIKAELPGLKREQISVTFEQDVLTISGERAADSDVPRAQYQRSERPVGAFRRSFTLAKSIDSTRAQASYQDGVLTVSLPQREDAKARQIQVNG